MLAMSSISSAAGERDDPGPAERLNRGGDAGLVHADGGEGAGAGSEAGDGPDGGSHAVSFGEQTGQHGSDREAAVAAAQGALAMYWL